MISPVGRVKFVTRSLEFSQQLKLALWLPQSTQTVTADQLHLVQFKLGLWSVFVGFVFLKAFFH